MSHGVDEQTIDAQIHDRLERRERIFSFHSGRGRAAHHPDPLSIVFENRRNEECADSAATMAKTAQNHLRRGSGPIPLRHSVYADPIRRPVGSCDDRRSADGVLGQGARGSTKGEIVESHQGWHILGVPFLQLPLAQFPFVVHGCPFASLHRADPLQTFVSLHVSSVDPRGTFTQRPVDPVTPQLLHIAVQSLSQQ